MPITVPAAALPFLTGVSSHAYMKRLCVEVIARERRNLSGLNAEEAARRIATARLHLRASNAAYKEQCRAAKEAGAPRELILASRDEGDRAAAASGASLAGPR